HSTAASMKDFEKHGFLLDRVVGLAAGAGEEDMKVAGWDTAQGYLGSHAGDVGRGFPLLQDLITLYKAEQQGVPEYIGWTYYSAGVAIAALMVEGIRLAIEQEGLPVTGEKGKRGYERIQGFTLGGLLPALTVTPQDNDWG